MTTGRDLYQDPRGSTKWQGDKKEDDELLGEHGDNPEHVYAMARDYKERMMFSRKPAIRRGRNGGGKGNGKITGHGRPAERRKQIPSASRPCDGCGSANRWARDRSRPGRRRVKETNIIPVMRTTTTVNMDLSDGYGDAGKFDDPEKGPSRATDTARAGSVAAQEIIKEYTQQYKSPARPVLIRLSRKTDAASARCAEPEW